MQWIIRSLDYAIKNQLDIINLSIGGLNFDEPLLADKIRECIKNNILIICSSGNEGDSRGTINFPGSMVEVVTVGSLDSNMKIAHFSSRGPVNRYNIKPDFVVNGENIVII
jgi:subtilisin family serine protease